MDRLLVDTNIIIDLLTKHKEFYFPAARLFTLSDNNAIDLYISSLTFANTHYIVSREFIIFKQRKF